MDKETKKVIRKDPKIILAFQWKNCSYFGLPQWIFNAIGLDEDGRKITHTYKFELKSGDCVYDGYWAVREEDGEVYSYSNEDFERLFLYAPKDYMTITKDE